MVISFCAFIANSFIIFALRATRNRNATTILITSLTLSDIWTISVLTASLVVNSYLPIVKGTKQNLCLSLILEVA
uniref:G-protein coupled receptors family 1 profile domain-containing protein n=1 Tax=Acrobeloides nanus TaxID=290746 RepID=A0A914DZ35_9BILA